MSLKRYRDPAKRIEQTKEYNKKHYRSILLTFNKQKDMELLSALDSCSSKTEEVRKWFEHYKKGGI